MGTRTAMTLALALAAAAGAGPPATDLAPGLDPTPLVAEPLGLRMHLPREAAVTSRVVNDRVIYTITGAEGAWTMRLEAVYYPQPGATAASLTQLQLKSVESLGSQFRVLGNEAREFGGVEGRLAYVQQALDEGRTIINGWLVLPRAPQTFVMLSMVATPEAYRHLRPLWNESFSTIQLSSEAEVIARRDQRLDAGRTAVDTLTEDRLRTVLGDRQWFRMYKPEARGVETEVGWMSLQCVEAPRGQLTPERSPADYSALEAEEGLMVLLEARAIIDTTQKHYVDVQGRYWMSWDRSQEAWSVRMTQRQGDASQTSGETGIRDRARLKVVTSTAESRTRDEADWTITDKAYLSQPEVFCLGRLLPRDGSMTGEMEFFVYDSRHRQLPRRMDRWNQTDDGNWELVTQSALDAAVIRQVFGPDGGRIRRVDGDGKITERIDPQELRRLWESKGLNTQ
jgi:hypothetical protein